MIGQMIRALRKKHGYSQVTLARELSVSAQIISNWERDCSIPSLKDIQKLAELFSCSIDFLVKSNDHYEMSLLLSQMPNKEIRRSWYNELLLCEDNDLEVLQGLWETIKKVKSV